MKPRVEHGTLYLEAPPEVWSSSVPSSGAGSSPAGDLRVRTFQALAGPQIDSPDWRTIELNLEGARRIDSVGLSLLVRLLQQVEERCGRLCITVRDRNLERLLRFTRLHEHADLIRS